MDLGAIRAFVNQSATLATFSRPQLNLDEYNEDDELEGNGEDEEEEEKQPAFHEPGPSKSRVTLRLSGGSSSKSSDQTHSSAAAHQFEYDVSQLETGNLSSMLADIGFLQQEEGNQWDFGAGGAQHFAKAAQVSSAQVSFGGSLVESSDRYKAMTMSAKMKWFDVHGDSLIREPDDLTFRRLFNSGKGRTPNWRVDFTKWCVFSSSFFLFFFQLTLSRIHSFFFQVYSKRQELFRWSWVFSSSYSCT